MLVLGTDPTGVPAWIGAAIILGLLAVLVGYVLLGEARRSALRRRHKQRDPAPAPPAPPIDELPPSYRLHDGGGRLAGWGLPITVLFVGRIAFDGQLAAGITLGLAALAAAIGLTIVFGRRRRRQRQIIAEVERRATDLPSEDLRKLVEVLEREHGRFEMRRLRRLIA